MFVKYTNEAGNQFANLSLVRWISVKEVPTLRVPGERRYYVCLNMDGAEFNLEYRSTREAALRDLKMIEDMLAKAGLLLGAPR